MTTKNTVINHLIFLLLVSNCLISWVSAQVNDTDVLVMEQGEERNLKSQPLPPMALKMKPPPREEEDVSAELPDEAPGEGEKKGKTCKSDMQATHPKNDPGTAMGKCYIPNSPYSKTCQAVMAVNKHYKSVESKVDPESKDRAIEIQKSPTRHSSCKGPDESTLMTECRACSIQLKPNAFGVQLTCYDCQKGHDEKSCHHTIKENSKFIVSATFFEMQGFDINATEPNRTEQAVPKEEAKGAKKAPEIPNPA